MELIQDPRWKAVDFYQLTQDYWRLFDRLRWNPRVLPNGTAVDLNELFSKVYVAWQGIQNLNYYLQHDYPREEEDHRARVLYLRSKWHDQSLTTEERKQIERQLGLLHRPATNLTDDETAKMERDMQVFLANLKEYHDQWVAATYVDGKRQPEPDEDPDWYFVHMNYPREQVEDRIRQLKEQRDRDWTYQVKATWWEWLRVCTFLANSAFMTIRYDKGSLNPSHPQFQFERAVTRNAFMVTNTNDPDEPTAVLRSIRYSHFYPVSLENLTITSLAKVIK